MKRCVAVILLLLICFCSCASNDEPIKENEVKEEISSGSEIIEIQEKEDAFSLVIPEFEDAIKEKFPRSENGGLLSGEWCMEGNNYFQRIPIKQYFTEDEEAEDLAKIIVLSDSQYYHTKDKNFIGFESIDAADNRYLLACAIKATPSANFGPVHLGKGVYEEEYFENITTKIISYVKERTGLDTTEVYYAEDVEKTFRCFYGEKREFYPESIENLGILYVPSGEVFLRFTEGVEPVNIPQILSVEVNENIYKVKAVWTSSFEYDFENAEAFNELRLAEGITKDNLSLYEKCTYILEKQENGSFIVVGVGESQE